MVKSYLSDTNPNYKCLEDYLKGGAFGALDSMEMDSNVVDYASDAFNDFVKILMGANFAEELMSAAPAIPIELPTHYDTDQFGLLKRLIEKIIPAAEEAGIDTSKFPYYSIIPTGLVNACAVKLPCSDRSFLLFDSQVFLYCYLFSKVFAACVPIHNGEEDHYAFELDAVKRNLEDHDEVAFHLHDILNAYSILKKPMFATPYAPPEKCRSLLSAIYNGMELFLVGHEFGHVYRGHLNNLMPIQALKTVEVYASSREHAQEYEADYVGLVLALLALRRDGFEVPIAYASIEMFFTALELSERFSCFTDDDSDDKFLAVSSNSHPSVAERKAFLRKMLPLIVQPESHADYAVALAQRFSEIAILAWQLTRDRHMHP